MKLADCLVEEETLAEIADEEELLQAFADGQTLQNFFGFSDEVLTRFYETALNLIETRRFEDAINAFVFLTALNPYLAEFWQGLGLSYQQNREHDNALYAYSVAFTLEERKIFPYVMAAQCCIEVGDYDQAFEILDVAEQHAVEHPEDEVYQQLKSDAEAAKEYVRIKQQGG